MSTITFYRQARRDGGVRTGIEINDSTVLARFEQGTGDADPSLTWYVDVRCSGPRLPLEPEAARTWLIRQGRTVKRLLLSTADAVPAGIDPDQWPLRKAVRVRPSGIKVEVACSATRRVDGQQIARVLRDVAEQWEVRVRELPEVGHAHRA